MIFGNVTRIAIQSEMDANSTKWQFGKVCLWASGQQIGDYSQIMILTIAADFFTDFLKHTGKRHDFSLESMPADLLISTLNEKLFNGVFASGLHELAKLSKQYRKFCVCPGGGEAFDGVLAFYIETRNGSRFAWLNEGDTHANEIDLRHGEFEEVLTSFIDWLKGYRYDVFRNY